MGEPGKQGVRKEYREYPARRENPENRASPVSEEPLGKRRPLGSRFIRVRATVAQSLRLIRTPVLIVLNLACPLAILCNKTRKIHL